MSQAVGTFAGGLTLVIPCFNEELAVQPVLRRCLEFNAAALSNGTFEKIEIIVVDDGSTDLSPSLVASYPEVRLIRLPKRLGYGAALKAGLLHAAYNWVAMIDMDATYDPMDFIGAAAILKKNPQQIILGDRLSQIGGMPLTRWIGNKFFVSLIRLVHGKKVVDSCTGFRLFSKDWILPYLRNLPDDLNFSLAMTLMMLRGRYSFTEMPIKYASRRGRSKLNIVYHGLEFMWTILDATTTRSFERGLNEMEEHGILPVK